MAFHIPTQDAPSHRRAKSSVLSISSFMHKRTPSGGAALSPSEFVASPVFENMPFLPNDHPHTRALGELQQNHQSQPPLSPKKSREGKRPTTSEEPPKSLHKKTLSTISLKSLAGKDSEKTSKSKDKSSKPKKTKSSTNLASLLSRPKSSKNLKRQAEEEEARAQKNKENEAPSDNPSANKRPPPIYAQFSSEYFAKQPLGGKFLEDEIDLYTPKDQTGDGQRNFYHVDGSQPSLTRRDERPQRPKSTYLPSSFSIQDIGRRVSNSSRHSAEIIRRISGEKRPSLDRSSTDKSIGSTTSDKSEKGGPTRSQRVLAAVSAFGTKASKPPTPDAGSILDKDVDKEFEAMLDRRNIPEHQRGKMRSLAMSMKKDFIRQDWAEMAAKKDRPCARNSDSSADATSGTHDIPEVKTKRPRSRTFTLSRGSSKDTSSKEPSSPTKKKSEGMIYKHIRTKSTESVNDPAKSLTSAGVAAAQNMIAKAKGQLAGDFVSYLKKVPKPELVEVGRLHKLRLLLRNETVAWTDDFIRQGGMEEIVGLLHRTMEVEWREEHEDALLHEVLLCLKALSTTALALKQLDDIQATLFPALLHMVFDEEKKGPSEFITRNIITWLLFTYLKSASTTDRCHRAKVLLSYLRDPEPTESQRPVGFVLEMRRPRPYRVWCKEVTNVTKEVFWIFLHHLNVIALPGSRHNQSPDHDTSSSTITSSLSDTNFDSSNPHHVYMGKHFPQERPPVPAAPYVGGVEWDATNYLASHLDIVNGIIACLPTQEERNTLREQMLVSGWEKCMGSTLRLCKEKFYGGVHAGLRCWVAAAVEDGWDTRDVRCGPVLESKKSPIRKPVKKDAGPMEAPPKINMKLDFLTDDKKAVSEDVWL